MRIKTSFILVFIVFILAAGAVFAETPREQLKQMVQQLQKNPNDNALREKIIKLAQELKPAPAVPDEAERRMVRGTAAFKGSKSVADYRDAAKEFEQAALAAPWYGDAYVNLGVAQDKAENYEAALRSLKLALLALPNDKEIKVLIYEVEYRNDKVNSAVAAVEQEKKTKKEFIEKLDGAQWQEDTINYSYCDDLTLEIHRGEIYLGWITTRPGVTAGNLDPPKLGKGFYTSQGRVEGRDFVIDNSSITYRGTISEDGEKIVMKAFTKPLHPGYPKGWTDTFHRVKNPQWTVMSRR